MDISPLFNKTSISGGTTFYTDFMSAVMSCPLVYIQTSHYYIIEEFLLKAIESQTKSLHPILGFGIDNVGIIDIQKKNVKKLSDIKELVIKEKEKTADDLLNGVLARMESVYENISLFILKDISKLLNEKSGNKDKLNVTYYLHEVVDRYERGVYREQGKPMCILVLDPAPASSLPASIIDYFTVVNVPSPSIKDINQIVSKLNISLQYSDSEKDYIRNEISRNFLGLSYFDINAIIRRLKAHSENLTKESINYSLDEKKRILSKSGLIQIIDTDVDIEDVGGLDKLKNDLFAAKKIFAGLNIISQETFNLPYPKGILIVGMPGCGKSLIAKAIANLFNVSLLRLDMDKLLGQYVGQSDGNLRRALQLADAAHPCVLWIDEVEKAFAGASGNSDNSMLIQRLMGQFLTWMQERKTAVYIVATANSPMKPEFMRKGRFDEVYFVDFPNEEESIEILKSKLRRYMSDNSVYDLTNIWSGDKEDNHQLREIARMMRVESKDKDDTFVYSFSGAEIESLVNTIMTNAYVKEYDTTKKEQKKHSIKIKIEDFRDIIGKLDPNDKRGMINNIQALQKSEKGQIKLPIEAIRDMQIQYNFKKA